MAETEQDPMMEMLDEMTDRQLLLFIAYNMKNAYDTIENMSEMVRKHGIMALLKGSG